MSGSISAGGLITGLDSESLIRSLLQLERQPITRLQKQVSTLEDTQTAVRGLRTTLQNLRNAAQDFQFDNIFNNFLATSSKPETLTATVSSDAPVSGAFELNVLQLATATEAVGSGSIGAAIDTTAALDSSGITTEISGGTIAINGVSFNIDPTTDSLDSILSAINSSAAGVTASYDAVTDKVTLANSVAGDTSAINFGTSDTNTSNFLDVIDVKGGTQLPDANGSTAVTSTRNLGAISTGEAFNDLALSGGAITTGTFSINGISITIDPATDTVLDVLEAINASDAGVSASYDATNDRIRVVSETLGSPTIRFGSASDTSNFLDVVNLDTAVQTAGVDTQFTVNGGAVQTRNTNAVKDAISGVTVDFLSVGTSTVTVSPDKEAVVEEIKGLVEKFNAAVAEIGTAVSRDGKLAGDGGIRSVSSFLTSAIFQQIAGATGDFESLLDIGISTGDDFNSEAGFALVLDEEKFLDSFQKSPTDVRNLFSNEGKTGVTDILFEYLDSITESNGFLNERAKANGTIDQQIQSANDRIERLEARLVVREDRLRRQFTNLEQISAVYQNQAAALNGIRSFL